MLENRLTTNAGTAGLITRQAADSLAMDTQLSGDPTLGPPVPVQSENGLDQRHLELIGHSLSLPADAGADPE